MCREVLALSPSFPRCQHLLKLAHHQSQVPGSLRSYHYTCTRVHRHVCVLSPTCTLITRGGPRNHRPRSKNISVTSRLLVMQ